MELRRKNLIKKQKEEEGFDSMPRENFCRHEHDTTNCEQ
jgi:hypothetical protein